jgi:hypothetical protein
VVGGSEVKNKIRVDIHCPYEMAQVKVNGELVFIGNFCDFYPGCHGTTLHYKKHKIDMPYWEKYGKVSPESLGRMIGKRMRGMGLGDYKLEVKYRKRPIPC